MLCFWEDYLFENLVISNSKYLATNERDFSTKTNSSVRTHHQRYFLVTCVMSFSLAFQDNNSSLCNPSMCMGQENKLNDFF